jgi:sugar/nucleoside kinase (ribokinase family)
VTPELVVLGNLLVDDLVFEDGRTRMGQPGGAVLHAALAASLCGVRVGVASWLGDDYPAAAMEALAARGVDLGGVRRLGRPALRTWLLYEGRRRQVIHRLDRPTHVAVSPTAEQIPEAWRSARAFHVAPMPFEIQRDLLEVFRRLPGALVTLDPYLVVRADTLEAWRGVLPGADALFLSEDDLELPHTREDPLPAMRRLAGGRLRHVVFKRGRAGGTFYDAASDRAVTWSPRTETVVDPTGAGDAFAAGVLAGWLKGESSARSLERGVVAASFALSAWGADGLLEATPADLEARRRAWFGA